MGSARQGRRLQAVCVRGTEDRGSPTAVGGAVGPWVSEEARASVLCPLTWGHPGRRFVGHRSQKSGQRAGEGRGTGLQRLHPLDVLLRELGPELLHPGSARPAARPPHVEALRTRSGSADTREPQTCVHRRRGVHRRARPGAHALYCAVPLVTLLCGAGRERPSPPSRAPWAPGSPSGDCPFCGSVRLRPDSAPHQVFYPPAHVRHRASRHRSLRQLSLLPTTPFLSACAVPVWPSRRGTAHTGPAVCSGVPGDRPLTSALPPLPLGSLGRQGQSRLLGRHFGHCPPGRCSWTPGGYGW